MIFKKGMIYAIADISGNEDECCSEYKENFFYKVEEALKGGTEIIQLRYKSPYSQKLLYEYAMKLCELTHRYSAAFIVNDYVELAKKTGADGVHIGQEDIKKTGIVYTRNSLHDGAVIGVTAKTVSDAKKARQLGADYIGSGAIFKTDTKADAQSMDIDELKDICTQLDIPVFAIGGIDISNVNRLKGVPITGIAVSRGIFAAKDIRLEVLKLKEAMLKL